MIFYRPVFKGHSQPLVHIFISNTKYIMEPNNRIYKTNYKTFEEYRKLYEKVTPWQCIAPKELGVWGSDE